MRLQHAGAIAALFAVAFPGVGAATSMVLQQIEELTTRADEVVRATTLETRAAWTPHRSIVTTARMQILEVLSGALVPGQVVEVTTPGGEIDGLRQMVVGASTWAVGEEVVLFLDRDPRGGRTPVDLAQGKFEVVRDPAGGVSLTRRGLEGVDLMGGAPGQPRDLDMLRARVARAPRPLNRR